MEHIDYKYLLVNDLLNKYKDWSAIAAGNEKRESYNFKHKRFKILKWLSHKKIINIYKIRTNHYWYNI